METLFVGKNLIFLPETDSTNSYAMSLLKNVNPPEGTTIHTAHQLRGKGQRGAAWTTEPISNLTVSIILRPGFLKPGQQFFLYIISALAVHDTTAQILGAGQFDIKIKWPNDILLNRKKTAGILIENKLNGEQILWSVIGIGLNVNQRLFDLETATSLSLVSDRQFSVNACLQTLCSQIEKYYLMLKQGRLNQLKQAYYARLYGLMESLPFEFEGRRRTFRVLGIGDTGLLIVESESGEKMEMDLRQLKWLSGEQA